MEYYKNILCVEASWMVNNGIITKNQYKNMSQRRKINVVRRGCRNTPALVAYESLPELYKNAVCEVLGCNPHEAAKISIIEKKIEHDVEKANYFDEYELPDGRHLPKGTRAEYYANAIVLDGIGKLLSDKIQIRKSRGGRIKHNWKEIAEGVQELDRTKYPHTLPANPRRLKEKYAKYKKYGLESLIHKNFLNKNAAKIDNEIKESYLVELLGSDRNLDNAQVARLYNMIAGEMGWEKISSATVAIWRDKKEITTYAGRRGAVAFSNTKAMQVKRKAPSAPLLFWTLDGWDVELLYQKTAEGKTTYHHRPTVVIVLDACLKYPVGYAIGTHETPQLIQAALRNAVKHTKELFGNMYRAHQIQSDRYAIKTIMPYYETIADKVTPARVKNAKAKIIEPYFNSINRKWCQMLPNWAGFGITSDREKQPNIEFLNRYKKQFPDFEGVCKQVEMIMQREREEKIERYMELWNELDESKKIILSEENYLLQFGETTGRTILLQPSGLHPTIMGQRRNYDCFDLTFRDHASTKWLVMYDPDDLSKALAVNEDETLRYMLEEKYIQPMALAERQEGDSEQLQRVNTYNAELVKTIIERRAKSGNIVREHMSKHNLVENETLKRLLITDSDGQHKNVKNKIRMIVDEDIVEMEEQGSVFDKY